MSSRLRRKSCNHDKPSYEIALFAKQNMCALLRAENGFTEQSDLSSFWHDRVVQSKA